MRRNSSLAILAILLSGCALPQPDSVYVDLDRVIATESAPELKGTPMPQPRPSAAAVSVKQPGLPGTSVTDRTRERLEMAKRLIAENRGKSIASLSSMLKDLYLAQAEDEIAKHGHDVRAGHDSILAITLDSLREVFEQFGLERGPLLAKLNVLARNTDLAPQAIPENGTPMVKGHIAMANQIRAQIRDLDARYNVEALKILAFAGTQIQAEIDRLDLEAQRTREAARAKAVKEAETQATQTQTSLNVRLKQLVPEGLPAVPARQVVVPGSAPLPTVPADTDKPIFGSLEERRHLLDQEVDIWIKTTGRHRSLSPRSGNDRTEQFLQWRSAHKVGP